MRAYSSFMPNDKMFSAGCKWNLLLFKVNVHHFTLTSCNLTRTLPPQATYRIRHFIPHLLRLISQAYAFSCVELSKVHTALFLSPDIWVIKHMFILAFKEVYDHVRLISGPDDICVNVFPYLPFKLIASYPVWIFFLWTCAWHISRKWSWMPMMG